MRDGQTPIALRPAITNRACDPRRTLRGALLAEGRASEKPSSKYSGTFGRGARAGTGDYLRATKNACPFCIRRYKMCQRTCVTTGFVDAIEDSTLKVVGHPKVVRTSLGLHATFSGSETLDQRD